MEKGSPLSLAIFFGKAAMVRDLVQRWCSVLRRHDLPAYITPLQIQRWIEMSSSPLRVARLFLLESVYFKEQRLAGVRLNSYMTQNTWRL